MRWIYLLIIASVFIISCSEENTQKTGDLNQACNEDKSCNQTLICNSNNICIYDPCETVDCGLNGDCKINNEKAVCNCNEGYHNKENKCIIDEVCDENSCTETYKTVCNIINGEIECSCIEEAETEGDSCIVSDICSLKPCKTLHKTKCEENGDSYICSCDDNYQGENCDECINGYHKLNEECIIDEVCVIDSCTENNKSVCSIESGIIVCNCDIGYSGDNCETCDTGYHNEDNDCIINQECQADSCTESNKTICSDENGIIKCSCDLRYIDDGAGNCIPPNECVKTSECGVKEWCNNNGECVCQGGFELIGENCEPAVTIDFPDRTAENICQKFNSDYPERAIPPIMDISNETCDSGNLHGEAINDAVRRINLYRWFAKLPPAYTTVTYNQGSQEAAMMMYINNEINHSPPTEWTCYTQLGASAAGKSSLVNYYSTPSLAINTYIKDYNHVDTLGNRRWYFNNRLKYLGIGHYNTMNVTRIIDYSASPSNIKAYSYPSESYYPIELLRGVWSLSIFRGAFNSDMAVTVTEVETDTELEIQALILPSNYGPGEAISIRFTGFHIPEADKSYKVVVTGLSDTYTFPDGKYEWTTHLISCE